MLLQWSVNRAPSQAPCPAVLSESSDADPPSTSDGFLVETRANAGKDARLLRSLAEGKWKLGDPHFETKLVRTEGDTWDCGHCPGATAAPGPGLAGRPRSGSLASPLSASCAVSCAYGCQLENGIPSCG